MFDRCFVFFFKQKTAYEMRISDWSSDVCSSDLLDLSFDDLNPRVLMFNMASYGIFRSPRHRPVILTASGSTLAWRRPAPQALADTFDSASLRVSCGCCGYSPNSSHLRD